MMDDGGLHFKLRLIPNPDFWLEKNRKYFEFILPKPERLML